MSTLRESFLHPSNAHRPLQIVHGLDRALTDPENLTGEEGIDRRLEKLREMGLGGIVANVGFRDYLQSPRQWEVLRYALRKAHELGLELWLYDEKGYPSGTAGGIVTRAHPEYVTVGLACYPQEVVGPADVRVDRPVSCKRFVWAGAMQAPASATRAEVLDLSAHVDEQGTLRWAAPAGRWTLLYLAERVTYEGTHAGRNVHELRRYTNVLMPEAAAEFIRVTHEQYHRELPPDIWQHIRAVFTDEPSFMTTYVTEGPTNTPVADAYLFNDRPASVPWSRDFLARFQADRGYDLTPYLFALFVSDAPEACYVRQDYYQCATNLFAEAFYGQVQDWCRAHGTRASGHAMAEENLIAQISYSGSIYALDRRMDLPGVDMLSSDPGEILSTEWFMGPKQVASVAHITGKKEVHSETSNHLQRHRNPPVKTSVAEMRGTGNLLYVLGVNQITSYYGWDQIGAEGYREYNDYMGRLATLLRGGAHVCDVAVLYPMRSIWAYHRPRDRALPWGDDPAGPWPEPVVRVARAYPNLVRGLLRAQIDLDILDEQAIQEANLQDGALCVADETYRAVVLPPLEALELATARALAAFCRAGGQLISVVKLPDMAESPENTVALRAELAALFDEGLAHRASLEELPALLRTLVPGDLLLDQPQPDVLYTHRRLEGRDLYFVINNAPQPITIRPALRVPGPYTIYRPLTATIEPVGQELALSLEGYEGAFVVCEA
ncbi:MAG: hypothetical protein GX552_06435 [Chloroflexi bacterium]|jgi:hypothetical protein|nr:hypothetical protein [Chloroflexota bacterium]